MSNSSRSSKLDRNREKVIQDRLQALLTKMLQDEDNKYCVDCDSKGRSKIRVIPGIRLYKRGGLSGLIFRRMDNSSYTAFTFDAYFIFSQVLGGRLGT